ncbi:MAG: YHS domain-containing protein, partial [Dehalococcoidia bacterium]|nr:YHS domain-containing protein [Dehalococcoidia bacterium]
VRIKNFGFVFQDFNLLSALTVTENVELAINLAGTKGKMARAQAEKLLIGLELGHRLKFRPDKLSGGEKQRVAIARALANEPEIILADEPTANLDSKIGHEIMRLLQSIAKEQGKCVIIVSHDHRIRDIADRVLWLEDGEFKELAKMIVDPVCGMQLERERAAMTYEYGGTTYYFCAKGCAAEFSLSPEKFVGTRC